MANFLVSSTLLESFDNFADWTITTGTGQMSGGKLELTTPSGTNCYATKTISQNFSSKGNFKINFNIANAAALASTDAIEVYISSSTSFASYFKFVLFYSTMHEGNNEVIINRNQWTNTGSESWDNTMVRLRVRVNARPASIAVMKFNDIRSGYYSRPKCVFNFDDGRASVYSVAFPYLAQYNFKATTYVNSAFQGVDAAYMTVPQLIELYNAGWDISNHSDTHLHMNAITTSQIANEISICENWIQAKGFTRNNMHKHFCYPYGDYNQDCIDALSGRSYLTARTTLTNRTQVNNLDNQYLLLWQGLPQTGNEANDLATAKTYVDRTINDGGVIMFGFHALVASPATSYDWYTGAFRSLVDYVASKSNQIDVMTLTEWHRGLSSPRKVV